MVSKPRIEKTKIQPEPSTIPSLRPRENATPHTASHLTSHTTHTASHLTSQLYQKSMSCQGCQMHWWSNNLSPKPMSQRLILRQGDIRWSKWAPRFWLEDFRMFLADQTSEPRALLVGDLDHAVVDTTVGRLARWAQTPKQGISLYNTTQHSVTQCNTSKTKSTIHVTIKAQIKVVVEETLIPPLESKRRTSSAVPWETFPKKKAKLLGYKNDSNDRTYITACIQSLTSYRCYCYCYCYCYSPIRLTW